MHPDVLKVLMDRIYSSRSLPSYSSMSRARGRICSIFEFLYHEEAQGTTDILEEFFADPSRSAEFFLGHINTRMALSSINSLIQNSSKHVANQSLPYCKDQSIYRLHLSICAYHLSHASILSPVLVDFPTIGSAKLRILGGGSDSDSGCKKCQDSKDQLRKAVTRFLLVCCNRSYSST